MKFEDKENVERGEEEHWNVLSGGNDNDDDDINEDNEDNECSRCGGTIWPMPKVGAFP